MRGDNMDEQKLDDIEALKAKQKNRSYQMMKY